MPRTQEVLIENSFKRGLITEATGMNFPENAAVEMFNCIPTDTGVVKRRNGFEYETDYETDNYDRNNSVVRQYLWKAAAGSPNNNIVVVQVGDTLYYYVLSNGSSISPGKATFSTDLDARKISGATTSDVQTSICDFTQIDGRLYVVHPFLDPFYVEYDSSTPTVTATTITIQIRDLEGSPDDPYKVDQRPNATVDSVDINHLYNLTNQGWANQVKENGGTTVYPLNDWDSARGDLPSNTDRWWMFKDSTNEFDTARISEVQWSTGEAAKGFYIINAFASNRNSAVNSEFATLDTVYSLTGETQANGDITETTSGINRPRCIAAFAGRVFYSGVIVEGYNNKIYFSQVLTDANRSGKCYQKNDPTDENFSDLLADDGGYIIIPEAATIYKLFPLKSSILVFASNGVWSIQGSEGIGFSATDYSAEKITSEGAISTISFVEVEGIPFWWNWNGIFTVASDDTGLGNSKVKNLTDDTIQTFYDDIPGQCKLYAQGAYNPTEKIVQWVYSTDIPASVSDRYTYNRVINLNVKTSAFYPWTIDTSEGVVVQSIINIDGVIEESETVGITVTNGDTVVDSGATAVTVESNTTTQINPVFKYFCGVLSSGTTYSYTYADMSDTTKYSDWDTAAGGTGVSYDSYFITGYALPGRALVESQMNYINVYCNTVENSSILMSTLWDYVNTTADKRWTGTQQAYKHDANHNVSIRRLKVLGKGQALQLQFKSSENYPFFVIGWSTKVLVDAAP